MACPVEVLASAFGSSDRDPLHNIPCDLLVAPVVEPGGARVGVASQVLHVFEGHALFEQVGDGGDAEGVP